MRMTDYHFAANLVCHIVKVKVLLLHFYHCMEYYLKEYIAEFLTKMSCILCIDSIDYLVNLFDKFPSDRFVRLHLIPRTAVRAAKNLHYFDKVINIIFFFFLIIQLQYPHLLP